MGVKGIKDLMGEEGLLGEVWKLKKVVVGRRNVRRRLE